MEVPLVLVVVFVAIAVWEACTNLNYLACHTRETVHTLCGTNTHTHIRARLDTHRHAHTCMQWTHFCLFYIEWVILIHKLLKG